MVHNFVKIAGAIPHVAVGNCNYNTRHIINLIKQAEEKGLSKDVEFYLEFFKYGCPPHGGFGLGIDRLTMLLLGLPSLKESMFIFRGPNHLNP